MANGMTNIHWCVRTQRERFSSQTLDWLTSQRNSPKPNFCQHFDLPQLQFGADPAAYVHPVAWRHLEVYSLLGWVAPSQYFPTFCRNILSRTQPRTFLFSTAGNKTKMACYPQCFATSIEELHGRIWNTIFTSKSLYSSYALLITSKLKN